MARVHVRVRAQITVSAEEERRRPFASAQASERTHAEQQKSGSLESLKSLTPVHCMAWFLWGGGKAGGAQTARNSHDGPPLRGSSSLHPPQQQTPAEQLESFPVSAFPQQTGKLALASATRSQTWISSLVAAQYFASVTAADPGYTRRCSRVTTIPSPC